MADAFAESFGVLNYSGMLFNKGNTRTPLSTIIGGSPRLTNSVEFVVGQEYETTGGTQPAISEDASLTAPYATVVTRTQQTNVTQIFHETLGISYGKMSNMGSLSGANIAGQVGNPVNELDFQVAAKMAKIARDIEYTFINGAYSKATTDAEINKSRGVLTSITTNVVNLGGRAVTFWDVCDALKLIDEANGDISDIALWVDTNTRLQLNADAQANGMTIVPVGRDVNGISLSTIQTPLGATVNIVTGQFLPAGTMGLFNLSLLHPVMQNVPDKGNFFLELLSQTGAGKKYQIFGQMGLDHGPQYCHAKITGMATTFTAPQSGRKVYIESPVPTIEVDATMTGVTLDKTKVVVETTATATATLNIAPATPGTFAYEWQSSATATGTFAADATLTGYQTATVTAPATVPAAKWIRCAVTSSGTVEAATMYSAAIEIKAAS